MHGIRPWREEGFRKAGFIFKDYPSKSIPVSRKAGKDNRRPVWINKELLEKKKKIQKGGIQRVEARTVNLG